MERQHELHPHLGRSALNKAVEDGIINLEIELYDLPELRELEVTGVKKRKIEEIIKENKLQTGVKVTENLITTTKNYLENKYKKKGFLNAKVIIKTEEKKKNRSNN